MHADVGRDGVKPNDVVELGLCLVLNVCAASSSPARHSTCLVPAHSGPAAWRPYRLLVALLVHGPSYVHVQSQQRWSGLTLDTDCLRTRNVLIILNLVSNVTRKGAQSLHRAPSQWCHSQHLH